jgi:hypothetical protein
VKTLNPAEVRTAALRHITGSKFTPDYYGDEITWRWVIFPWNYTEDMCNIVPRAAEGASDTAEIKRRLKDDHDIDMEEPEITRILKESERRTKP